MLDAPPTSSAPHAGHVPTPRLGSERESAAVGVGAHVPSASWHGVMSMPVSISIHAMPVDASSRYLPPSPQTIRAVDVMPNARHVPSSSWMYDGPAGVAVARVRAVPPTNASSFWM